MRILWDLRLFSFGYGNRGIGTYTKSLCTDFLNINTDNEIFILGIKDDIPKEISNYCKEVIPYNNKSWKSDLIHIPNISRKFKIDIIHYWVAMGPMHQIGMGFFKSCKTVATIHDLGVENWNNIPFLKSKKRSWYWKFQKLIINNTNHICFVSNNTKENFLKIKRSFKGNHNVLYPNIKLTEKISNTEKSFVVLGGSESKNLNRTIEAFNIFQKKFPEYSLLIHGNTEEIDKSQINNSAIKFVNYNEYYKNLSKASALIAFSLYEGLGIPPLEAISIGTPCVVSNMPSFNETLSKSAVYADPLNVNSMALALEEITLKNNYYREKVKIRYIEYQQLTKSNGNKLLEIYTNIKQKTN